MGPLRPDPAVDPHRAGHDQPLDRLAAEADPVGGESLDEDTIEPSPGMGGTDDDGVHPRPGPGSGHDRPRLGGRAAPGP